VECSDYLNLHDHNLNFLQKGDRYFILYKDDKNTINMEKMQILDKELYEFYESEGRSPLKVKKGEEKMTLSCCGKAVKMETVRRLTLDFFSSEKLIVEAETGKLPYCFCC